VVKSGVIYRGRARGACINHTGDKVAFLKLDGHVCVIGIDGKGFRELANTKNHRGSAMDWPTGDWVYYTEEARPPRGGFKDIVDTDKKTWGQRLREQLRDQRTIRRVNVMTGEDERVGSTSGPIWQLYLTANATKGSGKFATTGALMDFSNPGRNLNRRGLACGSGVSCQGNYVCEIDPTTSHDHLRIWDWNLTGILRLIRVNQFNPTHNDGRKHFYRPRWAVNSEKWLVLTHGTDSNCGYQSNMVLYNWMDQTQVQVTNNPLKSNENDEGEDFWLMVPAGEPQPVARAEEPQTPKPPPPPIKKLQPIDVEAALAATTPPPKAEAMAPYSDALVVFEYEVRKVLNGTYKEKKLRVAHWGVLDLKKTPAMRAAVGDPVRIMASPFQDHPELGGQFIKDALPQNYDLPLYYSDVSLGLDADISPRVRGLLKKLSSAKPGTSMIGAQLLGRLFAAGGDGKTGAVPEEVVGALVVRLRALSGIAGTWQVRRASARALGDMRARAALEPLEYALEDSSLEVVIAATEALAGILPEEEMRKLVHEKLNGAGHARSAAARYLAANAQPGDLEGLVTGLYADDWRARKHCAAGIAKIAGTGATLSDEACTTLAGLLRDDILNVVNTARDALVAARSPQAIAALVEAAKPRPGPAPGAGADDFTWRMRKSAIEALGRIGMPAVEEHLPVILAGLGDSDYTIGDAAQQALARMQLDEFYPQLLKEFEKTQTSVGRANILEAMSRNVPEEYKQRVSELALKALHEAEDKDQPRVRAATISLLGIMASPKAIEHIAAHVSDPSAVVRAASLQALRSMKLSDEQKDDVSAFLLPGLSAKDWRRALSSATALRYFPSRKAVAPLINEGLPHEVVNVQKAAVAALIACAADEEGKPALENALLAGVARNPRVWEYGANVFGTLRTKQAVRPLADMILADGGKDHWRTQANAARALVAIGVKNEDVEMALAICIQSEIRQVRDAGEKAIKALWPESR